MSLAAAWRLGLDSLWDYLGPRGDWNSGGLVPEAACAALAPSPTVHSYGLGFLDCHCSYGENPLRHCADLAGAWGFNLQHWRGNLCEVPQAQTRPRLSLPRSLARDGTGRQHVPLRFYELALASLGYASGMTESEFLATVLTGDEASAHTALAANPALAHVSTTDGLPVTLLALYRKQKLLAEALGELKQEKLSIFEAAALGRVRDVSVLLHLHRDRALEVSQDGFTALHLAAFFGHHYCAKLLLEERADPNAVSQNAMAVTPLHSALVEKPEPVVAPLVALLLNAKADPNTKQASGSTPLMVAQQNGHIQVEKLLRAKGAI